MRQGHPELFILRHGQTLWNAEGRMQGALDSPLTALGRAQAEAQGQLLAEAGALGLPAYASPQARAAESARIALSGTGAEPRSDARLREISLGLWDGLTRAQIAAGWPGALEHDDPWDIYDAAPGGEGLASVHDRTAAFLADLEGPAMIFTHGITSRVLRCIALGRPVSDFAALPGGQGVVYHVSGGVHRVIGQGAEP